jgi:hypothetical protein
MQMVRLNTDGLQRLQAIVEVLGQMVALMPVDGGLDGVTVLTVVSRSRIMLNHRHLSRLLVLDQIK